MVMKPLLLHALPQHCYRLGTILALGKRMPD